MQQLTRDKNSCPQGAYILVNEKDKYMSDSGKYYEENQGKERGQFHTVVEVGAIFNIKRPEKTTLRRGHVGLATKKLKGKA